MISNKIEMSDKFDTLACCTLVRDHGNKNDCYKNRFYFGSLKCQQ